MGSLTQVQRSIIVGSILGDGSLRRQEGRKNALLEINHAFQSKKYVDWKYRALRTLVSTPPKARKGNGKRVAYRFTTLSRPEIAEFYERFYKKGRKRIPNKIVLTPLVLAVWFMDDGSKERKGIYLNTQQFTTRTPVETSGISKKTMED